MFLLLKHTSITVPGIVILIKRTTKKVTISLSYCDLYSIYNKTITMYSISLIAEFVIYFFANLH
ncbi:hypothetical protein DW954_03905 [Clostridium sp. AM45-5]|nr:hypothetical protein DW954_03905 [Clostridium sp. AM45-5]